MSDKTEWLGYFVGWEERSFDFGVGADGESLLHPKKSGDRGGHKEVVIRFIIEEEVGGKWVRRQFLKEAGLESKNEKGIDPKKPIVLVTTVTGDTKVEWTFALVRKKMVLKPKLIEKKTENNIRVGVEFALSRLYRFDTEPDKKELKKKVGSDYVRGTRLKDAKKVRVKFTDIDDDITSEEFLQDGASAVEVKSQGILGTTFIVENAAEKSGRIDIVTKGPLYNSFKFNWYADMEKLGEKDTYVIFGME